MSEHNGAAPRILAVGEEPPPMRSPDQEHATSGTSKAKGKNKSAAGERFKVISTFADFTLAQLSRAEITVWILLWRDTRDGTARTAFDDLARRSGCNRSTVFRAVRRLRARGLLKVIHQGGFGRGPSRYRVLPLPKGV